MTNHKEYEDQVRKMMSDVVESAVQSHNTVLLRTIFGVLSALFVAAIVGGWAMNARLAAVEEGMVWLKNSLISSAADARRWDERLSAVERRLPPQAGGTQQ